LRHIPSLLQDAIPNVGKTVSLDKESSFHLNRVLRLRNGDCVFLMDGAGKRARAELISCAKLVEIVVKDVAVLQNRQIKIDCWMPLIKPARLEFAIEKITEMGVSRIIIFSSDNTGNKQRPADMKRLNRIIRSAVEQSGNCWKPELVLDNSLDSLLKSNDTTVVVAEQSLNDSVSRSLQTENNHRLSLLVGPEGGFSDREKETLQLIGAVHKNLGTNILRAETAMIALLSQFNSNNFK
jgi:16S rRNA (uracil1498-N3)-methyltransferase